MNIFHLHLPQQSQLDFSEAEGIGTKLSFLWQSLTVMPGFLIRDIKPVTT